MAINENDVRHVAKLARLKLSDGEIQQFTQQLGSILTYIEKLNELNTDGVEATAHAAAITNVLRDDVAVPGMGVDKVLQNAPTSEPPYFSVPKVLDQDGSA